jgi:hypothetical protein
MKKILVVLLSMALILAFGMTASAVDVKFSGSFYVVGVYDNNPTLKDDGAYSRAFYYTRTRLQPVFEVAPGLTLTTRIDALEKQWGQTDWRGGNDDKTNSRRQTQNVTLASGQSPKVQENFEFERAYLTFKTAIGQVDIGYQSSGKWGTDFGDDENTRPRMRLIAPIGPIQILAVVEKFFDSDTSQQAGLAHEVNKDNDSYYLAGVYNFTGGNAGILFRYNKWGYYSVPVAGGFQQKTYAAVPYLKGTFGPVYVEAEFIYMGGKAKEFAVETATNKNVDLQGYGAWLYAKANVGPAYVGGSFLYSSGDDGSDATKSKTGPTSPDLNIGLILGRDELQTWEGSNGPSIGLGANGNAGVTAYGDGAKSNMMMASLFVGMNPTPKTNVEFMGIWAKRLEVPFTTPTVDKNLGYEFDLTASYKIYDNLTYMVGAGYLLTGDYFKGVNSAGKTSNDYLLLNKLTLSF